jgi:hypothetical protein
MKNKEDGFTFDKKQGILCVGKEFWKIDEENASSIIFVRRT